MKRLLIILFVCGLANHSWSQKRIQHTVMSGGHPITVWQKGDDLDQSPILLVHGRTWSAVPDFDLQVKGEDLSFMDGLIEKGFTTYAVDLRGYGATPRDETGWVTPTVSADDVASVLEWIEKRHQQKAHLFGWSMGSTIALLAVNRHPEKARTLSIFGYWLDLDQKIPESHITTTPEKKPNTAEAAASDFIVPGTISQNAIDRYVEMCLEADPIKTDLNDVHEYNAIDPSTIEIPVLILQGEFDPIASPEVVAKLFTRLKTPKKQWTVIPGGDHAALLETPRSYFLKVLSEFSHTY